MCQARITGMGGRGELANHASQTDVLESKCRDSLRQKVKHTEGSHRNDNFPGDAIVGGGDVRSDAS